MNDLDKSLNNEGWYCPTCMVMQPVFHVGGRHNGEVIMELFCVPSKHFVTRFKVENSRLVMDDTAYGNQKQALLDPNTRQAHVHKE